MMLTTTPYLHIRRPSPNAIEFTVSTLPPLTFPLRLTLHAINLVRALLSSAILIFLYATWTTQNPYYSDNNSKSSDNAGTTLAHRIFASAPFILANGLAQKSDPRVAVPLCLASLWALTRHFHTEESLLVLRGLGIQTRSSRGSSGWWPWPSSSTRFIPTEKIRDVLINEAFRGFGVRYYLAVVVEGEPDVVVVFPSLLPCAAVVERVWRGVRECLYAADVAAGSNGKY
ncbi:GPI-GlcNAc transferase complex, PIG-H component-domain-containing protein [Xylaria sp. CBS 124048]|nr:GPI-GlcNAc transferase complex, PIG-H component-domain-containing protein [Xylaria sp. CBS 124048]